MSRYVKNFESFRNHKSETVNEELFGGLINFFKKLWNKATEELKKISDSPNVEQIDNWMENTLLNTSNENYIFKTITSEFKKRTEANDQDCLTLVDNVIDPETGILGKQGLQPLYDDLNKKFGKNLMPLNTIQYYFSVARNNAIKDYKFAGGPSDGKVDPKRKNISLQDTTHLPELKKLLSAAPDSKKKKEVTVNWVEKNLIPRLIKYIKDINPEDVDKYLASKGIDKSNTSEDLKIGDNVLYKREKFNQVEWDNIKEEDRKNTTSGKVKELIDREQVGIKKISKIDGEFISFEDSNFTKKISDILIKVDIDKSEEARRAAESLGKIKTDPNKMETVTKLADMLQDDSKKDQVAEIEKILGGNG